MTGPDADPHRTLSKLTPDQIRIEEQGDKITLTLAPDTDIVLDRTAPDRDLQHDYVQHLACAARIARTLMRRASP
ncbi:hypothetical protein [Nocardiopsis suaedae]|uniref:Uncharacterized protein n=1 Tax=Nocardiopsis suaedae TaxID=3018444 RepID=A0ABT4TFY1_9ACTN|nr:hypothetical protein [Nocardiopsis suaedae]MDA2803619.1 hypothetical protein [Nocardiopsis suaedae]